MGWVTADDSSGQTGHGSPLLVLAMTLKSSPSQQPGAFFGGKARRLKAQTAGHLKVQTAGGECRDDGVGGDGH